MAQKKKPKKSPRIVIRPLRSGEEIPRHMEDDFNREAAYEVLIPGVKNPRVTREDIEYYGTHVRPATVRLGLFLINPKTGRQTMIGFATGGLKRIKFALHGDGVKKTSQQWHLFPMTSVFVEPEYRRRGWGDKLLKALLIAGMEEGHYDGQNRYKGVVILSMMPITQRWFESRRRLLGSKLCKLRGDCPGSCNHVEVIKEWKDFPGHVIMLNCRVVKINGKALRATNGLILIGTYTEMSHENQHSGS